MYIVVYDAWMQTSRNLDQINKFRSVILLCMGGYTHIGV